VCFYFYLLFVLTQGYDLNEIDEETAEANAAYDEEQRRQKEMLAALSSTPTDCLDTLAITTIHESCSERELILQQLIQQYCADDDDDCGIQTDGVCRQPRPVAKV
jgi:hypothetical protein